MKIWCTLLLALMLIGCNARSVKQGLSPEQQTVANLSRLQFDCSANRLAIFEDFPVLVRSADIASEGETQTLSAIRSKQDTASLSSYCFTAIK